MQEIIHKSKGVNFLPLECFPMVVKVILGVMALEPQSQVCPHSEDDYELLLHSIKPLLLNSNSNYLGKKEF